jgi:putative aminopeptidase FrvX
MKTKEFSLLEKLCSIHAPSGNESPMSSAVLEYIAEHSPSWKCQPVVYKEGAFMDSIVLVFGTPKTAAFAHMDSIGFSVGYDNNLIKIGGPKLTSGFKLRGNAPSGPVLGELLVNDNTNELSLKTDRIIERGTDLTFVPDFREDSEFVQCCSMDNRLGVWTALKLAETLENGAIVFSCYEEHGGGSASFLGGFLYEKFQLRQALICDITWVTHGVHAGGGVAVSLRDSGIPRKSYLKRIHNILDSNNFNYQTEVESAGGSDGNELQKSPYPFDWCFIGAPEEFVHSPDEKVHKQDIEGMLAAYQLLMKHL